MNCELHLWILWLPFELLPRILDVPRTYLPRSFDVSWMYLESIFCLATILLPSSYHLPTILLPSSYPLFCIYQKNISYHNCSLKNSAFINSELPIAHWIDLIFQFSTFNSSLWIVNCQLWISIILCVNTDFWKIFKFS